MKKMIPLLFVLFGCLSASAQQITSADLLAKSKRKKTTGWILLSAGGALITGVALSSAGGDNTLDESFRGLEFIGVGMASAITSIPFFARAGKLKRQAKAMAFSGFQSVDLAGIGKANQAVIGIKISL